MKSREHRTRDLLFRLAGEYMLIHVPTIPQLGKHGYVVLALHWHNLQLERGRKLFIKYAIFLSDFAMPAGIFIHGCFVALMIVGHTSRHSLKEFKDNSGGYNCWERKLLIGQVQMKTGMATELRTHKASSKATRLFLTK